MSQEQADQFFDTLPFADEVDDYEFNDITGEHIYALENGDAVVISSDRAWCYIIN